MSEDRTTVFYLIVFREYTSGVQQRVVASVSSLSLMRFIETEQDNERRGVGGGGYDVYYVDVAALEVARYDTASLRALMESPRSAKAKAAAQTGHVGEKSSRVLPARHPRRG